MKLFDKFFNYFKKVDFIKELFFINFSLKNDENNAIQKTHENIHFKLLSPFTRRR